MQNSSASNAKQGLVTDLPHLLQLAPERFFCELAPVSNCAGVLAGHGSTHSSTLHLATCLGTICRVHIYINSKLNISGMIIVVCVESTRATNSSCRIHARLKGFASNPR